MTAPANSAQVETRGACGVPTPCTKVPCARRLLLESLEDRRLLAIDFYAVQNLAVGSYLVATAVADFDADGNSDMAVADYNLHRVSVLRGNGDGTFQAQPT